MLIEPNSQPAPKLFERFPWVSFDLLWTSSERVRNPTPGVISKPRIHHQKSLSFSFSFSSAATAGAAQAAKTITSSARSPGRRADAIGMAFSPCFLGGRDAVAPAVAPCRAYLVSNREAENRRAQLALERRVRLVERPPLRRGFLRAGGLDLPALVPAHLAARRFRELDLQRAAHPVPAVDDTEVVELQGAEKHVGCGRSRLRHESGLGQRRREHAFQLLRARGLGFHAHPL